MSFIHSLTHEHLQPPMIGQALSRAREELDMALFLRKRESVMWAKTEALESDLGLDSVSTTD